MTNLATYTSTTIATLSVRFSSVYRALWQPIRLRQMQHRFPSTSLQSHCWQPIRLRQLQHAKQSNYRMQCSWQPIRLRQLQRIHAITMILSTILATYTSTPIATYMILNPYEITTTGNLYVYANCNCKNIQLYFQYCLPLSKCISLLVLTNLLNCGFYSTTALNLFSKKISYL